MKKDPIDVLLRESIDAFVEEMNALVRRAAVEAVSDALGATASAGGRLKSSVSAPSPGRGKKRTRRSLAELEKTADKIEAFIRANPGCKMEDVSSGLRAATKDLRRPIQFLHEAKRIKTKGQRRGMQYFVGGGKKASSAPPSMPKAPGKPKKAKAVSKKKGKGKKAPTKKKAAAA